MSRSGYNDDCEQWDLIRWRGAVAAAVKGKRGQALLLDVYRALESLPERKLISGELVDEYDGSVCALGAVGKLRGIDMTGLDPEDPESVAKVFDIPESLAREIVYMNDEVCWRETPEARFERMQKWAASNLLPIAD